MEPTLALDASGTPHVVYHGRSLDALGTQYAHRTGDGWIRETVDNGTGFGDVVFDAAGRAHVSYEGPGQVEAGLWHAIRTGGSWSAEFVDLMGYGAPSLALDSAGRPAIAYEGLCPDSSMPPCESVKYARWTGTLWETEVVNVTSFSAGDFPDLMLDAQDVPHIVYLDGFRGLRYATRVGTAWRIDHIEDLPVPAEEYQLGFGPAALALDPSGQPHIAYAARQTGASPPQGTANARLAYALKYASYNESGWRNETVDGSLSEIDSMNAWQLGLDFDPAGHPAISYAASGLKVATGTGTGWTIETVDGSPDCVSSTLAFDSSGGRHIAYSGGEYQPPGNWTFGGCAPADVTYAYAMAPGSAATFPWDWAVAILASGVLAAVVVVFLRARRKRKTPTA